MTPYRDADARAPHVLACSGLDPSGGAGLIADVRVIAKLSARPVGVVTALTVQNTTGVVDAKRCDPDLVGHQLVFLMTDIEVRAVKIGMLGSAETARAIANALHLTHAPVVWDPILAPTRGTMRFLDRAPDALAALKPHLTLVTPNKQELFELTGLPTGDLAMAEAAARRLALELDCAVLIKGGHFTDADAIDLLVRGSEIEQLRGPRVRGGEDVHGTGCALSAAIATHLAHGRDLLEACHLAKQYVGELIDNPARPGRGAAAVI